MNINVWPIYKARQGGDSVDYWEASCPDLSRQSNFLHNFAVIHVAEAIHLNIIRCILHRAGVGIVLLRNCIILVSHSSQWAITHCEKKMPCRSRCIKPTGVWRLDHAFAPLSGHRGLPIPANFTFQYSGYADDNKCWHHRPSATPVSNNMRYNFSMYLLFSASFGFVIYFCHICMCMGEITGIYMQMLEEGI